MMIRLLLIRHAATDESNSGLLLGATDSPASAAGLQKMERMAALLDSYRPGSWYCSPMLRAVQTAEKLHEFGLPDLQFKADKRLREIDFGRWERKSFAEIEAADPDLIPAWSRYDDFVFPEGEAVNAFTGRIAAMLDVFRAGGQGQLGVVTHGGVIRTMICLALGISTRNYLLFNVAPASLTILDLYPEGGVLSGLNV